MTRTRTLGVRLSPREVADLRVLMARRHFESAGQMVRALIREELCRGESKDPKEGNSVIEVASVDIARPVDAGIP